MFVVLFMFLNIWRLRLPKTRKAHGQAVTTMGTQLSGEHPVIKRAEMLLILIALEDTMWIPVIVHVMALIKDGRMICPVRFLYFKIIKKI